MVLIANAEIEFINYVHMVTYAEVIAKVIVPVCLGKRGNKFQFPVRAAHFVSLKLYLLVLCVHKSPYNAIINTQNFCLNICI